MHYFMDLNIKNSVIIIADTNLIYAQNLVDSLLSFHKNATFLIANSFNELQNLIESNNVYLLITDIYFYDITILSSIPIFLKQNKNLKILINSNLPEEIYAIRSISSGAHGYVTKDKPVNYLHNAILYVLQNSKFLSDLIQNKIVNSFFTNSSINLLNKLSNRELQIAQFWYNGVNNVDVAKILQIQPATLKGYYRNIIFKKTQVNSYLQLFQLFDL